MINIQQAVSWLWHSAAILYGDFSRGNVRAIFGVGCLGKWALFRGMDFSGFNYFSRRNVRRELLGMGVGIPVQDYKSIFVAVVTRATLVNTQTHRETVSF